MKKMMMALAILCAMLIASNVCSANNNKGKKSEAATYWKCTGDQGKCVPVAWDNNGNPTAWVAGKLSSYNPNKPGAIVEECPIGYIEKSSVFLMKDEVTGEGYGLINAVVYLPEKPGLEIICYELAETQKFTNYSDWLRAFPK
jgi:hypothetical protein